MPSPELIQLISGLGLTGGCLIAIWAFFTDRIVTGKTLARIQAEWQGRIDEAKLECGERVDRLENKLDASTEELRRTVAEQAKTIELHEAIRRQGLVKP
jgi:hypothetical protein